MRISGSVYQFKATLRDISPPIWRRLQVRSDCTLHQLHGVMQVAMGWGNYHHYQFIVAGNNYGLRDSEDESIILDAKRVRISDVFPIVGIESEYIYDFGDNWQHDVRFESVFTAEPDAAYPRCVDGARNCPPEDVGGFGGYEDYLAAIADPNNEAHDEMKAWRGPFDPEAFSIEQVNQALTKKCQSVHKPSGARRSVATGNVMSSMDEHRQVVALLSRVLPASRTRASADETVSAEITGSELEFIGLGEIMGSSRDRDTSASHNAARGFSATENLHWSQAEKRVARKAFDLALNRELEAVMLEARKRTQNMKQPSDLWNLESYLTERRKRIDRQFDYRYSVLIQVFGELLHRSRLSEEDLQGLSDDKLEAIRRYAAFLSAPMPGTAR
jgi:hypothetical protein